MDTDAPPSAAPSPDEETEHPAIAAMSNADRRFAPAKRTVSLESLKQWLQSGKLRMDPDFQREFCWPKDKSSGLVVTALSNRLVPDIVLWERERGTFDVVDGLQRTMSLLGWMLHGKMCKEEEELLQRRLPAEQYVFAKQQIAMVKAETVALRCLSGLKDTPNAVYEGFTFDQLCQRKDLLMSFSNYQLSYNFLPYETPSEVAFDVFFDINSGGAKLSEQHIRRALFHKFFIDMLDRLALNCKAFQEILAPKAFRDGKYQPPKDHSDREYVLRVYSFVMKGNEFSPPMRRFLNNSIIDCLKRTGNEEAVEQMKVNAKNFELQFPKVIKVILEVFGAEQAFRKPVISYSNNAQRISKTISLALYDAMFCAVHSLMYDTVASRRMSPAKIQRASSHIRELYEKEWMSGCLKNDRLKVNSKKHFIDRRDALKSIISKAVAASQGERRIPSGNSSISLKRAKKDQR